MPAADELVEDAGLEDDEPAIKPQRRTPKEMTL
jgi:hypothetical protein